MNKLPFISFIVALFSLSAAASSTRSMYFAGYSQNVISIGLVSSSTSQCSISLSNGSSTPQSVTVKIEYQAKGLAPTDGEQSTTQTFEIPPGGIKRISVDYPAIPVSALLCTHNNSCIKGTQELTCKGKIDASDSSMGRPGFILASGSIRTVSEAGHVETDPITGNASLLPSPAINGQTQIVINGGKPF